MMTTTTQEQLDHLAGCPDADGGRLERYVVADADSRAVGVARCQTCGATRYDRTPVPTDEDGRSETAAALLARRRALPGDVALRPRGHRPRAHRRRAP